MDKSRIVLVALFFICKLGLACNPGWKAFNGKCYQIASFNYDLRLGRKYCQMFDGDLAYINSSQSISFLKRLEGYDEDNEYWLREDSMIERNNRPRGFTTVSPSGCAYMTEESDRHFEAEDIEFGNCDEKRYFICEVVEQDSELECPRNWHFYGSTCYKSMPDMTINEKASEVCAIQGGRLAILDDIAKERHAMAVTVGLYKTFLVGATAKEDGVKWSNGKEFLPSCPQCIVNSTEVGECLGFQTSLEHPFMLTWVHLNCSSMNYYLCEISPSVKTTTPLTTLAPTTTTLPTPSCPYGYNWKSHEASGFCFWETTYETVKLNWYQARTFCKAHGGDLATYEDEQQEVIGLGSAKGHYRGLWFGLQRNKDNVFHWVDGMQLKYTNWGYHQPDLNSSSKFCAVHAAGDSKWELDYCGVRRWFICKAPKTTTLTLPDTSLLFLNTNCNFTSTSVYSGRWYLYGDHCYLVRDSSTYSWDTAQNFCNDNEGHLASIHSFAETDFIISLLPSMSERNFWIGLSARGLGSSYTWSDGTPLDFLYWPDGFTYNETQDIDACVTFNSYKGSWSKENCNRLKGIICERGVNISYEFTTPEPTPALPGHCEHDWYLLGNKCYRIYGNMRSQRLVWNEARNSCQNENAELASIHNNEEQEFLTDLLLIPQYDAWIGLQSDYHGTVFQWSDDSPLDYTNWNGLDLDDWRSCVEISFDTGTWNSVLCTKRKAYVCQKPKNPTIKESSGDPFTCSNITGWHKLGDTCYGIFEDQKLNWMEAQTKCKEFGASLVSFRNSAVRSFLKKRINRNNSFLWTGLREMKPEKFELVNGQKLQNSYWLEGQPQRVSEWMENCVVINSDVRWMVKYCQEFYGFICEWNPDDNEEKEVVAEEEQHVCPNSSQWLDLGGDSCYIFGTRMSWTDANHYCFRHGGHLASFHSSQEISLLVEHMIDKYDTSLFHIGLARREDGSYSWVDGSPLDYTNWENQPGLSSKPSKACVQMFIRSGEWQEIDCVDRRECICSVPKIKISHKEPLVEQTFTEIDISSKLTIGGIFGIIICLLVVVAIIGVTAYYLCPSRRTRVPLENEECL